MKINHALAMALSALSAGLLISCAKPADENKAPETDSQEVAQDSVNSSAEENNDITATINVVDISTDTETAYLTHVANDIVIPAYADVTKQSDLLHDLAQTHCQSESVSGDELQALRDQWLVLAQAWARAEMINFGPATASMSNLYINYYPDERGLVHSGVADLIAA
ncbi:MAG: imelysin family protein, partial [Psychrobacter sp.]